MRSGSGQAKAAIRSISPVGGNASSNSPTVRRMTGSSSRDPPRRKSFGHEAADPVVERRVDLDDVGHLAVSLREHRRHLVWKRLRGRLQRPGGRKGLVIFEDSEDIVVARNHPQIEGRHVEDGLMPTGRREDIERILSLLWREWVKARRQRRSAHHGRH